MSLHCPDGPQLGPADHLALAPSGWPACSSHPGHTSSLCPICLSPVFTGSSLLPHGPAQGLPWGFTLVGQPLPSSCPAPSSPLQRSSLLLLQLFSKLCAIGPSPTASLVGWATPQLLQAIGSTLPSLPEPSSQTDVSYQLLQESMAHEGGENNG